MNTLFKLRLHEAEAIVNEIIADLQKRGGLGEVYFEILPKDQTTLKAKWAHIVRRKTNAYAKLPASKRTNKHNA